jgi:hypothetical protein
MHQRISSTGVAASESPSGCLLARYLFYPSLLFQDADSVVGDDERRNQAMVHGGWSLLVVGTLVEQLFKFSQILRLEVEEKQFK